MKKICGLFACFMLLGGCSTASNIYASLWNPDVPETSRSALVADDSYFFRKSNRYVNDNCSIGLQNSFTREVVHCRNTFFTSAEECAQKYEAKGYTRFRDIPYKTANYDFLKVDNYPTRRWRANELTPRW